VSIVKPKKGKTVVGSNDLFSAMGTPNSSHTSENIHIISRMSSIDHFLDDFIFMGSEMTNECSKMM
jgi:hypothetical protein